MLSGLVRVPVSLLLNPDLLPSVKIVWVALRLLSRHGPVCPALVQSATGLSRPTVRKALIGLAAAGWAPLPPMAQAPPPPMAQAPPPPPKARAAALPGQPPDATQPPATVNGAPADNHVTLPGALVTDQRVGVQARLLYGLLQLTPGFRCQSGQFSYTQLCGLLSVSRNTVKRAVRELVQSGWLQMGQRNQLAPICFTLDNPERTRVQAEVAWAQERLDRAAYLGEALMREYLSLLVDSHRFEDNAAPGFLVNPYTGERLQLDRYYSQLGVAFEFQGPQHYGPTERFSQDEATRQRGRDLVKLGICVSEGITLQVIHAEDLSLQALQAKVAHCLPMRDLCGREPLISYLESVSRRYRRAARRHRPFLPLSPASTPATTPVPTPATTPANTPVRTSANMLGGTPPATPPSSPRYIPR